MDVIINELALPPRDHNQPPLADLLDEENAPLKSRADELVAAGGRAIVIDRDTAERATLLCGMMIDHGKAIEAARTARKQPFLDAGRSVDLHFGQLRAALVGTDPKRLGGEALRVKGLVDDFYREEERRAEAERSRLEEEARQKREEAERAEREQREAAERAREAALAGDVKTTLAQSGARVDAEIRGRLLQDDARRLTEQALQTRAAPINTGLGVSAHRKSNYKAVITDPRLALRHAIKINRAAFEELTQAIYDRQVRAGVRSLPGADVVEDRSTIIRRA